MTSDGGATLHAIATAAGVGDCAVFGSWDAYGAVGLAFVDVIGPDRRAGRLRLTSEDAHLFYIEIRGPEG